MAKYKMGKVWEARRLILRGYSVDEVSRITGIAKGSIYSYTKSERAKIKG